MGDVSVAATAVLTIAFVWMVSCLVTRLESLPIDFAVAGISLVLLFVDLANRDMSVGPDFQGLDPVWVIGFVLSITLFFSFFTIGIFKFSKAEPPSIVLEYGFGKKAFAEFGYWASMVLSIAFLIFSVSAASKTHDLLRVNLKERGGVSVFYGHVTSEVSIGALLFLAIFIGLTFLLRYVVFRNNPTQGS